jgi:class 3 adenylate cyclase
MTNSEEMEMVFLVADLSGYTALTEAHGGESAASIVTRYFEIVEEMVQPDASLVERIGDEVLIVSESAENLIRLAINLQKAIEKEPHFPSVHVGIHAGRVFYKQGRYFGTALNLASRVAAHARGGQILCTDHVTKIADQIKGVEYCNQGLVQFKNITEPVTVFEIVTEYEGKDINLIDPVCRMMVRKDTAPARIPYGGEIVYFCSFDCAKVFVDRPNRYIEVLNRHDNAARTCHPKT